MRKYRARQRSDPIRYQQYLERERMRNYKRKYEKRIKAAQERAQALGISYIVLEPSRRGRKPMFDEGVTLVLPSKYEDDIEDESNSCDFDYMPMMPVQVELHESDEIYQEQIPNISVVSKFLNHPRSALQTLLPQQVNDRERVTNFIKLEHDYVKQKTDYVKQKTDYVKTESLDKFSMHDGRVQKLSGKKRRHKRDKYELLNLQTQCRSFILNKATDVAKPKRSHQTNKITSRKSSYDSVHSNRIEHEDLDDLFKELAEVASKEPPKKRHSSPHKKSSRKHSPRKESFFQQMQAKDDGGFSLIVSMPVQPLVASQFKTINIKSEPKSPSDPCGIEEIVEPQSNSNVSSETLKKSLNNYTGDIYCNEDSIEIKQEAIHTDDDFY